MSRAHINNCLFFILLLLFFLCVFFFRIRLFSFDNCRIYGAYISPLIKLCIVVGDFFSPIGAALYSSDWGNKLAKRDNGAGDFFISDGMIFLLILIVWSDKF